MKAFAQAVPELPLRPACNDGDGPTLEREGGPFFKPNSPLNRDLYSDAPAGERITVAGFVLDTRCRPLGGSLVEIWHGDENGDYDSVGFRLRGHQFADTKGRWWSTTIMPALYPGRTRHFHFKVQRPGRRVRTTQLHFPGEPRNAWQSASVFLGRRIGSYGLRGLVHPGWDGVDVEEGRIPAGRRLQSGRCPQQISTASYRLA